MKNKKALSQIVSAVVLILITLAAIAIIWGIVQSFVVKRLDKTKSCSGILNKIRINDEYTCYDEKTGLLQISIIREDVDVDSLLVGISMETYSETFTLTEEEVNLTNVKNYPYETENVSLPSKEGGKTYYVYGINSIPEKIDLAPKINKNQCGVSDFTSNVVLCTIH